MPLELWLYVTGTTSLSTCANLRNDVPGFRRKKCAFSGGYMQIRQICWKIGMLSARYRKNILVWKLQIVSCGYSIRF